MPRARQQADKKDGEDTDEIPAATPPVGVLTVSGSRLILSYMRNMPLHSSPVVQVIKWKCKKKKNKKTITCVCQDLEPRPCRQFTDNLPAPPCHLINSADIEECSVCVCVCSYLYEPAQVKQEKRAENGFITESFLWFIANSCFPSTQSVIADLVWGAGESSYDGMQWWIQPLCSLILFY